MNPSAIPVETCSNEQAMLSSSTTSSSLIVNHLIAIIQIIINRTPTTASTYESIILKVILVLSILCSFIVMYTLWNTFHISYHLLLWYEYFFIPIPLITIPNLPKTVTDDDGIVNDDTNTNTNNANQMKNENTTKNQRPSIIDPSRPNIIRCFDPSTDQYLGEVIAMTSEQVDECCRKASIAQKEWCTTSYQQRRIVLRTTQKYIVQHSYDICRVSARDSGKPIIDGYLGEILTTTEKIRTICEMGELWLLPSYRTTGLMFCYKIPRVEYIPYGIIAPIAPWNYPYVKYIYIYIYIYKCIISFLHCHLS
jgi:hypothetical protein